MSNPLVSSLQSLPLTGCQFISIKDYENKQGEVSDYLFNVGISYENAVETDIKFLESYKPTEGDLAFMVGYTGKPTDDTPEVILENARQALLDSLQKKTQSSQNRSEAQKNAYENISPAVRQHKESGKLMVYGLLQEKTVIKPSDKEKKRVNSAALTLAKNVIRKQMKTENFRQFDLDGVKEVHLKGKVLLFE